jgi:pyruvate,orthophosphate dikinase
MNNRKWVYLFSEGNASMRDLLGGKGAGVAEMTNAGLPVPPGFTITTEACLAYYAQGRTFPEGMWDQVLVALGEIEQRTGKKFGDASNPLLLSVRSGSKFSMPGMMDTVLNLGLNDDTVKGMIALTGDERFPYDIYRRFIQMFGKVVLGLDGDKFEHILQQHKDRAGVKLDMELSAEHLKRVVTDFLALVRSDAGQEFPKDPYEQLRRSVEAVFSSWNNKRAVDYRNFHKISHDLGTGVNVQMMVFGNMGADSGTGVAFTRNPSTGEKKLYGEYLLNAQGEDVVAGIRTPQKIDVMQRDLPEIYQEFSEIARRLEQHYRDMQDLEFTVERGKLWMLQTRTGKRTAPAAVKIAVDMVKEGLISKEEAIQRVEPGQVYQLLLPQFDQSSKDQAIASGRLLATGLNASPGAATGKAVFDPDRAEQMGRLGESVILVRPETSPDDVHGMLEAAGILTSRGGATSHAAVVARGLGKPCVSGVEAIKVDTALRQFTVDSVVVHEGDFVSIDGATGEVFLGAIDTIEANFSEQHDLVALLSWADEIRKPADPSKQRIGVWANADYPRDAAKAREFGAEGIGLTRTEHMFFEENRLPIVQQMILVAAEATGLDARVARLREEAAAASPEKFDEAQQRLAEAEAELANSPAWRSYHEALDKLLPIQKEDFKGIFKVMDGLPVIIRLLDPPLHEFLPSHEDLLVQVTQLRSSGGDSKMIAQTERLLKAVGEMREANPMLGLRGVRLGIIFPAIYEMQVRAILSAACEVKLNGVDVHPEIMIPLVGIQAELRIVREQVDRVAKEVQASYGVDVAYKAGTMIEIPRAALAADEIAEYAEFFSFGTNDMTQTTFGFSRDDAEGKFLLQYVSRGILPTNPFQVLDRKGVGELMRMAVEKGRKARPDIEIGICGEHGGDPSSIEFVYDLGLSYVSASPFRVPIARLAAAQVSLARTSTLERDR